MKKKRAREIATKLNDARRWNSHGIGINMERLRKNPDVKEIFEENERKLEDNQIIIRKGADYGLALPYAGKQLLQRPNWR